MNELVPYLFGWLSLVFLAWLVVVVVLKAILRQTL